MYRDGGRYSHWVRSSAAVALLADDRCAEVLGVGERESVECLQGRQTTTKSFSATLSDTKLEDKEIYLVYLEENLFVGFHQLQMEGFKRRFTFGNCAVTSVSWKCITAELLNASLGPFISSVLKG